MMFLVSSNMSVNRLLGLWLLCAMCPDFVDGLNCKMDEATLKYTQKKIQRAKVEMKPYPHVFIRSMPTFGTQILTSSLSPQITTTWKSIFDPQFYSCLLDNLPDGRADSRSSPFQNFKSERYLVKLHDRSGDEFPTNAFRRAASKELNIGFWKRFADLFATSELAKSWVDLLDATTGKRYDKRDPKKQPSFTYKMDLSRDMSGYEISPHTDTDAKWVTTLFYLPSTSKHANVGTAVMKSKQGLLQRNGTRHVPWSSDWIIEKRVPYVPNSVFAFAPCWHSWHAVPKMRDHVMRDTIQGFILSSRRTPKFPCGR